uniref:Uncharacterized protein n=1 Tax=Phaeomonas parva TaxID=124430 RepID=A0A7S1U454_9STRA|mmetsp:Transcript_30468/g.97223  ORF Transcript_30468/g.97223 Transcript_30468/m.97223 type:complete len:431 (+) Transcript_30468:203-1495(+)
MIYFTLARRVLIAATVLCLVSAEEEEAPAAFPTLAPTVDRPRWGRTDKPTAFPTSDFPTVAPTEAPTPSFLEPDTSGPTAKPAGVPIAVLSPSMEPTDMPHAPLVSYVPTSDPRGGPGDGDGDDTTIIVVVDDDEEYPTSAPTSFPTTMPSMEPTAYFDPATAGPTNQPTFMPTAPPAPPVPLLAVMKFIMKMGKLPILPDDDGSAIDDMEMVVKHVLTALLQVSEGSIAGTLVANPVEDGDDRRKLDIGDDAVLTYEWTYEGTASMTYSEAEDSDLVDPDSDDKSDDLAAAAAEKLQTLQTAVQDGSFETSLKQELEAQVAEAELSGESFAGFRNASEVNATLAVPAEPLLYSETTVESTEDTDSETDDEGEDVAAGFAIGLIAAACVGAGVIMAVNHYARGRRVNRDRMHSGLLDHEMMERHPGVNTV